MAARNLGPGRPERGAPWTAVTAGLALLFVTGAAYAQTRLPAKPPALQRTAVPMTLDQPLACPVGQTRSEIGVAHEAVVPTGTLGRVRFEGAQIPAGALTAGRVTWRLRPTAAPNLTNGRFNILVFAEVLGPPPGYQNVAQIHAIGSVPVSPGYTSLIAGPWNSVAYPAALLVAADMIPGSISQFNANRAALQGAGFAQPVHVESQVGCCLQTTYAILETCHAPAPPGAISSTVQ